MREDRRLDLVVHGNLVAPESGDDMVEEDADGRAIRLGLISPTVPEVAAKEVDRERLLLAYAREFVGPRPYPLDDLAQAVQMSIPGVRTGYGDAEVDEVERLTGERPWRR
jgi:hypothetical protein